MKASKWVSKFKRLVTKETVAKEFTDMIREEEDIFWSKPIGSSADFHRAFHSKKTHKALRYVMAVAGILGEENALSRSLSGLRSKLHFKVEPQYTRHKGRLKLSHFEVKGYSPSGYGEYLKINTVAKRMMMGTPSDPPRVRYGVNALSNDQKLTREYAKKVEKWFEKKRKRYIREQKTKSRNAKRAQEKLQKLIASRMIGEEAITTPENYVDQILAILERDDEKEEVEVEVNKKKKGKKTKTKVVRAKKPTRKLTKAEKKRILKAFIEVSKHLQGIMWIMHWTIKLNDTRRKFIYIDEDYVPVDPSTYNYDLSHQCKIDLYGFPEHALHYCNQHRQYWAWFNFFEIAEAASLAGDALGGAYMYATKIEGERYTDEEWMQDDIDVLLDMCSETLMRTTEVFDLLSSGYWIFWVKIVNREFKVPAYVHKHTRHTTKNKAFQPRTDLEKTKSSINRYKMIHGNYWSKSKRFEY